MGQDNKLIDFCALNSQKLANNDRQELIKIADEIDALKTMSDHKKKAAAKMIIEKKLAGLKLILTSQPGPESKYSYQQNLHCLRDAIAIAQHLLRQA